MTQPSKMEMFILNIKKVYLNKPFTCIKNSLDFSFFIFNIFCPKVYCTKHFYKVVTPFNLFSLSSFLLLLVYFLFVGFFYVSYSSVVVLMVSLSFFCHYNVVMN
jgi:hypothetical protein